MVGIGSLVFSAFGNLLSGDEAISVGPWQIIHTTIRWILTVTKEHVDTKGFMHDFWGCLYLPLITAMPTITVRLGVTWWINSHFFIHFHHIYLVLSVLIHKNWWKKQFYDPQQHNAIPRILDTYGYCQTHFPYSMASKWVWILT